MAQGRQAPEVIETVRAASIVPRAVAQDEALWTEVNTILHDMLTRPMAEVISQEPA
ncbi:hypothetical protein RA2_01221 [Roseovarius sp. A-2]|uniref:hypothetical protein n=1 Tax=Roseovarius sp. A-2 TaxID=1570360 RepID=UPI0009D151DF|nr:hypothetical protein [Roseovarius sp. A-2]GAW34176.1 hypothetical protein RA2_01221 [Roseovarius sp. A-2]